MNARSYTGRVKAVTDQRADSTADVANSNRATFHISLNMSVHC